MFGGLVWSSLLLTGDFLYSCLGCFYGLGYIDYLVGGGSILSCAGVLSCFCFDFMGLGVTYFFIFFYSVYLRGGLRFGLLLFMLF